MVQNYVWRLRKALADGGGAEILTHGRGYELRIDRELVDVLPARTARHGGRPRGGGGGEPGGAAREALALFHGDPLSRPGRRAVRDRGDPPARGAAPPAPPSWPSTPTWPPGATRGASAEIDALLAENPLRERLHAQRMLALYRCGRQAEALEAYRQARATLVEQIGVEPAPELQRLHDAILRQDPALDVEPAVVELRASSTRRRRRR